jgi:omega-6 fatty acid desaturase (delta-12 desaturase)
MCPEKQLIAASKAFASEVRSRSWWEFLVTLFLLLTLITSLLLPTPLPIKIFASFILGLTYVRMFVIYHDFRHRAILQKSWIANALMNFVGVYLLAPEQIWNRSHEHHHNNNSKLTLSGIGSYPTISKTKFLSLTKGQQLLYLVNRHPLTIICGYFTLFIFWLNLKSFIQSPKKHFDSLVALVFHISVATVIWSYFGWATFVLAWFAPFFIMAAVGSYLFYCQHNFPGACFKENKEWSYVSAALASTSFLQLSPVMHWFTANIGYHHVHHLNSRIPFYRLKEAMASIPELNQVSTTSFHPMEVIRCLQLKLWDEEREEMITLNQLRQSLAPA